MFDQSATFLVDARNNGTDKKMMCANEDHKTD